jgi:hypothetical protein
MWRWKASQRNFGEKMVLVVGWGVLDGSGWYVDMILVGGSEHFLFFHILGIIIPTD